MPGSGFAGQGAYLYDGSSTAVCDHAVQANIALACGSGRGIPGMRGAERGEMAENGGIVHTSPVLQRPGAEMRLRRVGMVADIVQELEPAWRRFLVAGIDVGAD